MSTPAMRATVPPQPWRCLCLGLVQMTRTTRRRRMTLQCSHMGLTLGLTFMRPFFSGFGGPTAAVGWVGGGLAVAVGDATPSEVVGRDLHLHAIAREDPDA